MNMHDIVISEKNQHFIIQTGERFVEAEAGAPADAIHQDCDWNKTLMVIPQAMASQAAWKVAAWCHGNHGSRGRMKEFEVARRVRYAAACPYSDIADRALFLKAVNFMFA